LAVAHNIIIRQELVNTFRLIWPGCPGRLHTTITFPLRPGNVAETHHLCQQPEMVKTVVRYIF